MRLVVGLGNPGKKFDNTYHNIGFMVLDKIADRLSLIAYRLENQFQAEVTQIGGIGENRVIFAKPQTFMNNSGDSVQKILSYYKIGTDDLLVISDDIDLELGTVRTRFSGSSGGHKGLESIIQKIGDNRFLRIRMGIGSNRNKGITAENYVLRKIGSRDVKALSKSIDKTADIVLNWVRSGEIKEETITI